MKVNKENKEKLINFIKDKNKEGLSLVEIRDLVLKEFKVLYHISSIKYWVKIVTNDKWLLKLEEMNKKMLKWKEETENKVELTKEEKYLECLDKLFKGEIKNKEFEMEKVDI